MGLCQNQEGINFYSDSAPALLLARTPTTKKMPNKLLIINGVLKKSAVVGVLANNNSEAQYYAKSDGLLLTQPRKIHS